MSSVPQYWSILADETQDCSTCEQVSLCIRYVQENEVTSWGLNMDNWVGQCYDGAATMSPSKNGVEGKIRNHYKNATYVHCHSHVLTLVLAAGCKQVTEIKNLFDNVGKLTWILSRSAKRKAILEHVSVASKENADFAEQLVQTDDDMLNESDIAIKQGSQ